jgi:hypothetical protein
MTNDIMQATTSAMENAVLFCAEKMNYNGKEQVLQARKNGDCAVCEYLRYGFAKNLAGYLGSMDKRAKAVYIYDEPEASLTWSDGSPDGPINSPGIRMIIWVSRKSPALSSLVDTLSVAVEEESRRLACPKANGLCHQLDVIVVDDQEVEHRTGYGALIQSIYLRPIEIWHR